MTRRRRCRALPVLGVAAFLVVACGSSAAEWDVASVDTIVASTTTTTSTRPMPTPTTTRTATTTKPTARPRTIPQLASAGGTQAIVVTAAKYGATRAQFTAYERTAAGWKTVLGPWSAWVGSKGVAPPGAKREGDGRTPSGTYGIDFMFGVDENPGVHYPYRVVTGPNIVWVEDPNSPNYNRWVDANTEDVGNQSDSMYKPQYRYGAVINYNTAARTPGLGSGIFIHLSRDRPSAGCITLPIDQLLAVLRWLAPSAAPSIIISVAG